MAMSAEKLKKLKDRKKKLKENSEGGAFTFVKANETKRIRILPVGEDDEICMEIITFYLGENFKRIVSPKTFGMPCAIMEKYDKLKDKEPELAKSLKPKKMYVAPTIVYDSVDSGKKLNEKQKPRLALFTPGVYQAIVDYSLDPEHGDPSDPDTGFDLKWTRTGTGMKDTEYSIINSPASKLHPAFAKKKYNIEEMLKSEIPSYAKTKEIINQFLGDETEEEEEGPKTKPKKKKVELTPKGEVILSQTDEYYVVERDGKKIKIRKK